MGGKPGFTPLMAIIIVLLIALGGAALVFEFFGKLAEKKDESDLSVREARHDVEETLSSPHTTLCYDQKIFWNWQTGDRAGLAQVYFGPNNESAVGSLLDSSGKKTVYTFDIDEDGKARLGVANSDSKAYGTGSMDCKSMTISIEGACDTSCDLRGNADFLSKHKIDASSLGFGASVSIVAP